MLRLVFVLTALVGLAGPAAAQEAARLDTAQVYPLDAVVVTADRAAGPLARSTGAVAVLRAEALRQRPVTTLADALEQTPGFAFLRLDGLGYEPQATVRGFYGGGEAEYVVVLVDGRPLGNFETGIVNWNQLPLAGVERVEVLRGGASSLYGDAAIGAVVNVVTAGAATPGARLSVRGGSHGSFVGAFAGQGRWRGRRIDGYADVHRTDGYRDHAARTFGTVGGSVDLLRTPTGSLRLATRHHGRQADEPGPLTESVLAGNRTAALDVFRFDEIDERTHRLALDGTAVRGRASLSASLTGERRRTDAVRTLPLSPDFFDTKNREVEADRLLAAAQLTVEALPLGGRLVAGLDASAGRLGSRYYQIATGDAEVYRQATGDRGALDADGTARRTAAALFAQLDLRPAPRLKLTAGARLDALDDTFEPTGEAETTASHTAFSPKAGVNVRYVQTARHVGHVYASVARSFKAPTLDQLFDQRTIPVPFPPFGVTISNAELKPQHGTSVEAGLYHRAEAAGPLAAEVSLAVYQIDMTDELDFDFETFRFVNIAESRHRGVEAGLSVFAGPRLSAFANYTLQHVTAQNGAFAGNFVKAIPRDFVSAGLSAAHRSGVDGSVIVRSAQRMFLDDANTLRLPGYTTADARLGYRLAAVTLALEAFNLFDAAYSTTGFPDPAGQGVLFLYPAAGRTFRLGLAVTR